MISNGGVSIEFSNFQAVRSRRQLSLVIWCRDTWLFFFSCFEVNVKGSNAMINVMSHHPSITIREALSEKIN